MTCTQPLNHEELLREFDNDRDFILEAVTIFLDDLPAQLETVDGAIAEGDAETLRKAAHKIKGGALNLSAMPVHQAALTLEQLARDGKLDAVMDARETLLAETERLRKYVGGLRA